MNRILEAHLRRQRDAETWHSSPGPGGRWSWHASAIGGCRRQAILHRAASTPPPPHHPPPVVSDGFRLGSLLTFEVGSAWHTLIQNAMRDDEEVQLIGAEVGGHHRTLPLAAKADLLWQRNGKIILADIKTESTFAARHRHRVAAGHPPVRPDHVIQLAATALVVVDAAIVPRIDAHWLIYLDRETHDVDCLPIPVGPELLDQVVVILGDLEDAWQAYCANGILPPKLPPGPDGRPSGLCRPRSATDPRGYYCPYRSTCYAR